MTFADIAHLEDLRKALPEEDRRRFAEWLQELYRRTVGVDHVDPRAHGLDFAIAVLEPDA